MKDSTNWSAWLIASQLMTSTLKIEYLILIKKNLDLEDLQTFGAISGQWPKHFLLTNFIISKVLKVLDYCFILYKESL